MPSTKKTNKNNLPLTIDSSKYLEDLFNSQIFTEKTTLDKIDYLNKLRYSRYYYGTTMIDKIVDDQYRRSITFNHIVDTCGVPCSPLYFFWDANYQTTMIRYPVDALTLSYRLDDTDKSALTYSPNSQTYATRKVSDWLRYGTTDSWSNNGAYVAILNRLKSQYDRAWLNLKRRKVAELKATLDGESVGDYVAQKRAEKTQAIMNIAMSVSNLTAKLETYRNRIGSITNVADAKNLFSEVENAFQSLSGVQYRNVKRLNVDARIPGGARVKRLADNGK